MKIGSLVFPVALGLDLSIQAIFRDGQAFVPLNTGICQSPLSRTTGILKEPENFLPPPAACQG